MLVEVIAVDATVCDLLTVKMISVGFPVIKVPAATPVPVITWPTESVPVKESTVRVVPLMVPVNEPVVAVLEALKLAVGTDTMTSPDPPLRPVVNPLFAPYTPPPPPPVFI